MKIMTVVGARPQFIKAAPVSTELRKHATEILVHTGQHFDANMSDVFFDEMRIPRPDYHLGIGGGGHGDMTGQMLSRIEEVLLREKPDWMLVYGDTNSTLAGALAAAKLHVPVAHIEAGLRSFNRQMPEEINRILTDHLSGMLFAPTETAVRHLSAEGITRNVHQVGDVMKDATLAFLPQAKARMKLLESLGVAPKSYALVTIHRAENTDDPQRLRGVVEGLALLPERLILPMHPRTKHRLHDAQIDLPANVTVIDPVGYVDMLLLEASAKVIITDSGGVQKEAAFMEVPCITLRNETEWTETVESGWNTLVGADPDAIVKAYKSLRIPSTPISAFGDGHSSARIASLLLA